MNMLLAQATRVAPNVLEKVKAFEVPTQQEFITEIAGLGTLEAVVIFVGGLVCLLQGWKLFKVIVVVNAAALGAAIGWHVGGMLKGENAPLFCGAAGGLLLAALAWPAMKYAIGVMGGLAGAVLGYGLWTYAAKAAGRGDDLVTYAWVGALIGLITLGLLAFVVFRLVVMIFTSFQGAAMAVAGLLALLLKNQSVCESIQKRLATNIHLMPLLIAVPAMIGFAVQQSAVAKKAKKKKKAAES